MCKGPRHLSEKWRSYYSSPKAFSFLIQRWKSGLEKPHWWQENIIFLCVRHRIVQEKIKQFKKSTVCFECLKWPFAFFGRNLTNPPFSSLQYTLVMSFTLFMYHSVSGPVQVDQDNIWNRFFFFYTNSRVPRRFLCQSHHAFSSLCRIFNGSCDRKIRLVMLSKFFCLTFWWFYSERILRKQIAFKGIEKYWFDPRKLFRETFRKKHKQVCGHPRPLKKKMPICAITFLLLGSLSNDGGDVNKNGKKAIGFKLAK